MTHAARAWAMEQTDVSNAARLILLEVAECTNAKGVSAWPSRERLQKVARGRNGEPITERQLRRLHRELEAKGKMAVVPGAGAGRGKGRRPDQYVLAFNPITGEPAPIADVLAAWSDRDTARRGCPPVNVVVRAQQADISGRNKRPPMSACNDAPLYIEENQESKNRKSASPTAQHHDATPENQPDFVDAEFEEIGLGKGGDLFGTETTTPPVSKAKRTKSAKPANGKRYVNGHLADAVAEAVAIWNAAARDNHERGGWAQCTNIGGKSSPAKSRRTRLEGILQDVGVEGWRTVVSALERDQWWTDAAYRRRKSPNSPWLPNIDSVMRDKTFLNRLEQAQAQDEGAGTAGPSVELRAPKTSTEHLAASCHDDGMVSDARMAEFVNDTISGMKRSGGRVDPGEVRASQRRGSMDALDELNQRFGAR